MADGPRRSGDALAASVRDAQDVDFFELLRRIEEDGAAIGRGGAPAREPVRLGQTPRLTFATRSIEGVAPATDGRPPRIDVNVIGLLGPEGPMPLKLTRSIRDRMSNRWFAGDTEGASTDTTFLDLCNVIQHRAIALFWRAWADMRPHVQAIRETGGPIGALLRALAGLGLPEGGAADDQAEARARDVPKLASAHLLARLVRSPDRLVRYLETVVGAPVALTEFVGEYTEIPARQQSRLGGEFARLGRSTVAGRRYFSRQETAELRIGPLDLAGFTAFLDEPARLDRLVHALTFAQGRDLRFHLRFCLRADEVPAARLGASRLGQTGWLGGALGADRADFALRDIQEWRLAA